MRALPGSILIGLLLFGCAVAPEPAPLPAPGSRFCESSDFLIDARFETGSFDRCEFTAADFVEMAVEPEDPPPINDSPWYAFRVSARRPGRVTVRLAFEDAYARYWPKTSPDRASWARVEESRVRIAEDGKSMEVDLEIGESSLWVAAQEIVPTGYYDRWIESLAARTDLGARLLGRSARGRPIHAVETVPRPETVLLLGRQHPPEVSGALAMRPFADAVLADTPLARRFRQRYQVILIPLLNPDGVALGHWRHNAQGVDLNRDWGPFTQPETRSVARLLAALDERGARPRLMLDFHSTKSTLCYTQLPDEVTDPPRFASRWLAAAAERLPELAISHEARARSDRPNTKNYFFSRYGIPAITVEMGDGEDRELIARAAPVLAEEMMRLLLEYEPP